MKIKKDKFAINFYKLKKLSLGKAAKLAELSRYEFEKILSKNKISISNLYLKDVQNDIKKLELI